MSSARARADARPESFPQAATAALANARVRANIRHATTLDPPQAGGGRRRGARLGAPAGRGRGDQGRGARRLDEVLVELEASVQAAGGIVHWARDAAEANEIVVALVRAEGADEVVKVKSLATDEIRLNEALEGAGIRPIETDLAELIVQLADERPSHLLVPAIHKNRAEIRDLFRDRARAAATSPTTPPSSRRRRGSICARRSCARGSRSRARTSPPPTRARSASSSPRATAACARRCREMLITVMGIEKAIPRFRDLEVFLQLLPRSSTGERMNPYTSLWTGVRPGDGPQRFHLVLLDAGRTRVLADPAGRPALRCIRCSACINVCPVYRQTGGHAYHSPYAGPIGAILAPQLAGEQRRRWRRCRSPRRSAARVTTCARC